MAAVGYALLALVILGGIVAPDGHALAIGLLALAWVLFVTNAWGLR